MKLEKYVRHINNVNTNLMNILEKFRNMARSVVCRGSKLIMNVDKDKIRNVVDVLNSEGFDTILSITVVDIPDRNMFIIRYIFSKRVLDNYPIRRVIVQTYVSRDRPEIDSISDIYPFANYLERECYEMFGVRFIGNDRCRGTFFLDKSLEGKFPLRKI